MCGYVYTPEVYPTSMRGIGLGACSGAARIGCMITPFVAMVSRTIAHGKKETSFRKSSTDEKHGIL